MTLEQVGETAGAGHGLAGFETALADAVVPGSIQGHDFFHGDLTALLHIQDKLLGDVTRLFQHFGHRSQEPAILVNPRPGRHRHP